MAEEGEAAVCAGLCQSTETLQDFSSMKVVVVVVVGVDPV
jgi:hypothetical protein